MSLTSEIRPKTGSLPIFKSFVTVKNQSLQACNWDVLFMTYWDFSPLDYMKSSVFCTSLRISKICTGLSKQKIKDSKVEVIYNSFFPPICNSLIKDVKFFYFFSLILGENKMSHKALRYFLTPPPPKKNRHFLTRQINVQFFSNLNLYCLPST